MMKSEHKFVYNVGIKLGGYTYRSDELCTYINGRTAVRMLTEILEGRYHSGHEVLLPTRLIIRDSVKGLNHMHTKSGQS